jgi:hypothetical protein
MNHISTSSSLGLVLAGVFGLIFGVLLQKGRVANYNVIVNLFRFRDMTVLKIMMTAIVVGSVGVYLMNAGGLASFHIKPTYLLGLVIGGGIFGIGMALYGYCPGTGVAAVASGSIHALIGFFGMLAGGIAYAFSYPWVKSQILSVGAYGKVRLADITPVPSAVWIVLLAIGAGVLFFLIEKHNQKKGTS